MYPVFHCLHLQPRRDAAVPRPPSVMRCSSASAQGAPRLARLAIRLTLPLALSAPALARDAFHTYGTSGFRSITLPPVGAGSFDIRGDFLPDGRIVAVTSLSVFLEDAPGAATFHVAASLDPLASGGPSDPAFLRVSPDGQSIAIGGGFARPVIVFAAADLGPAGSPTFLAPGTTSARYFAVPHFEAAWADPSHLALTAGDFASPSVVTLLDVTSPPTAPTNPTIISNIAGASAGIAFDHAGRLFTGNGFDIAPGGSDTGTVRAFLPADWVASPADFEIDGTLVGEVLSAGSLLFDPEGNLFVGGGDFGADFDAGYLAVVNTQAISHALAGMGPINPADPAHLRRLDPLESGAGYFASAFNPLTHELAITSGSTWFVTVPAPASAFIIAAAALPALRRRRHGF
ncbi:MAG: hypothetical protein AB7G11_13015 [Phycisphaerales bacterium]